MTSKIDAFMAALPDVDGEKLCSPPGLGGLWRVRHIRSGLMRRALVRTSEGIVFARAKGHGICENCAHGRDSLCTHCRCVVCVWEREAEERGGPLVSRERVLALVAQLKTFQIGAKTTGVSLADD